MAEFLRSVVRRLDVLNAPPVIELPRLVSLVALGPLSPGRQCFRVDCWVTSVESCELAAAGQCGESS